MTLELATAVVIALLVGALIGWLLSQRRTRELELTAATLQERLKSEELLARERASAVELAMEQLRSGFQSLAGDTLRSQSEVFLKIASERLGRQQEQADGTLRQRQQAIDAMVQPIREALQKTEATIHKLESERKQDFGSIQKYLSTVTEGQNSLQRETRNLVNALRRPEVRGRWGEITLKRVVELSGMTEHCDFEEQVHTSTEDGNLRPDMIVHMPDDRDLVVDVKTPLDAYLEAIEATTDEARNIAMRRHAQAMSERVRELSSKSYWAQFERSPEFVVLFIPGEQFLSAALAEQPALLDDALRQGVILTTPSSFMGLLKAVAYGWRQMSLARNAEEIRRLGEELYKRLDTFQGHLARVGKSLAGSVAAYNDAVGSLERSVLPGARRFPELGIRNEREIARLEALDREPRPPTRAPVTDDDAPATD